VVPEKMTVAQLVTKFQPFIELEDSLLRSQEQVNGRYLEPDESSSQSTTLFLEDQL
jgi:hypothetical protein